MSTIYPMAHRAFLGGGDREASPLSVAAALFAGSGAGGLGCLAALWVEVSADLAEPLMPVWQDLSQVPEALAFFTMMFAIPLVHVGAPCWFGLHRLGVRGWLSAILLGAVLSGVAAWAVIVAMSGMSLNWSSIDLAVCAFLIALGSGVGLVVWWVAYRPAGRLSAAADSLARLRSG